MEWKMWSLPIALGFVGGLWALVLSVWGFWPLEQGVTGCVVVIAGVPLAFGAWRAFKAERDKATLDREIIDGLLQASALPQSASVLELFAFLANGKWGVLSKEFAGLYREIVAGRDGRVALLDWAKRQNRPVVSRASALLSIGIESGGDLREVFRQVARDLLETESILRERETVLWMQKATLLLSAGILVPAILGSVLSASSQLELGDASEIGLAPPSLELVDAVLLAAKVYVVEFALLAAASAAFLSEKRRDAFLFALVLCPLAWMVFQFSGGG